MQEISSPRQKFLYSFGNFGSGIYNGLNNWVMPLFLNAFTNNTLLLGYLSNTRTMEGVVIQPLVGRLSDRTASPLGRRRPFILFGIPLAVLFLALVPLAGHAGHHAALPLIAASVILFSITWNIAGDPYQALMIDITPDHQRSRFNAILSVVSLFGQILIIAYTAIAGLTKKNIPDAVFFVCVAVMFLSYAIVFFGVREPKEAATVAKVEEKIPLRVYIREMRVFNEALKCLVSIFFLWTGLNAILSYLNLYTKHVFHVSNSKALVISMVLIVSTFVAAYPFGALGARYGKRRMIVVGTVGMIIAAVGGVVAPSYGWLFPIGVLAGFGFSATTVLTYPYLAELVPGSKIGVFTGLQAAFSSVAVPLSVAIASLLIHFVGYRGIFVMLTVMMVFDVLVLLSIDESAAERQVREVEEEERLVAAAAAALPAL